MNKIVLITLGLILNTSVLAKSAEDIFLDMSVADNVGALYAFNEDDDLINSLVDLINMCPR
jgi:hypothetical protein